METKLLVFFGAMLPVLVGALSVAKEYPGGWQLAVAILSALAAGTVALKLYETQPPSKSP